MNPKSIELDILVVGAGLAGLMAATVLQTQGLHVTLVDKSRSVGGWLATRRMGPGRADHGAQFFTVHSAEFQTWVDQWLAEDLIYCWSTGWSDGSPTSSPPVLSIPSLVGRPRAMCYNAINNRFNTQGAKR